MELKSNGGNAYGDDVVFLANDWMVGLVPLIMTSVSVCPRQEVQRVKSEGLIGLGSRVTISGHVHGDLLRGESGSGCSLVVGQSARHRLGCGCSRLVSWQR